MALPKPLPTLEKYNYIFENLFSQVLHIVRDREGNEVRRFIIPIEFANKKKHIKRIVAGFDKPEGIILPRLSYESTGININPNRRSSIQDKIKISNNGQEELRVIYKPTPCDINFTLHAYTETYQEMYQLIETIYYICNPHIAQEVLLIDGDVDTKFTILFKFDGNTAIDHAAEGSYEDRDIITCSFNFICNAFFLSPAKDTKGIKELHIGIYNLNNESLETLSPKKVISSKISSQLTEKIKNTIALSEGNLESNLAGLGLTDEQIKAIIDVVTTTQIDIAKEITTDSTKAIEDALNFNILK